MTTTLAGDNLIQYSSLHLNMQSVTYAHKIHKNAGDRQRLCRD